jgi:hypothetical protein
LEVKTASDAPSRGLGHFSTFLPGVRRTQLVSTLGREETFPGGTEVRALVPWLAQIDLTCRDRPNVA